MLEFTRKYLKINYSSNQLHQKKYDLLVFISKSMVQINKNITFFKRN